MVEAKQSKVEDNSSLPIKYIPDISLQTNTCEQMQQKYMNFLLVKCYVV